MNTNTETIRTKVREQYGKRASRATVEECCGPGCCTPSGYSADELAQVPAESFLGEGSGNPVRHADLRAGETVVDLGSGAGIDVFLAATRVGPAGRVIGVDMTPQMLDRARRAAAGAGAHNVEFLEGVIESLPLPDSSADVVLSNCVINLSPDKAAVFRETFRVLRPGGRLVISDIVQERPLLVVNDECGCVENAMLRSEYFGTIRDAGFEDVKVLEDRPWRESSAGIDASALTLRAIKPKEMKT